MRPVQELLSGEALPVAEWDLAHRNAVCLIDSLSALGRVEVTHKLDWIAGRFRQLGWNLARSLDPHWWPRDSRPERTIILAIHKGDKLLACMAVRWIWVDGSLRQAHENGRFFYSDYADLLKDPVRCRVTAATCDHIAHCAVAYSCGLRLDDSLNNAGERISWKMVRLAHLLCGINWHWSWLVGRTSPALARRHTEPAWGLSLCENGIYVSRQDGTRETAHHLVGARVDQLRRQFQRPEYGTGESLGFDTLPLFQNEVRHG